MSGAAGTTLAALLPAWLLRTLAEDPTRPHEGGRSSTTGAILFVDLTGFSTLADRLEREARAGPEQLAGILGGCFDAVVGCIVAQGGDVIRFAGDALVALFPATTAAGLAVAVSRAGVSALAAHRAAEGLDSGTDLKLRLRTGIGVGEVGLCDVGGEGGHWDFLAFGAPILDATAAQLVADIGETVLDRAAHELVRDLADLEPRPDGRARLRSVTVAPEPGSTATARPSDDAVRAYLPEVVLRRFDAGHDRWLAEYREASVLFVNLVDPAFATLERAAELQHAVRAIQSVILAVDGSINLVVVDDKGVVVVAAFGLPLMSREDDAIRAVLAARDVDTALRAIGVNHGIGLTRGRVFCGLGGSAERGDYVMLGHVVNVAARLMKAAGGGILCDGASARSAKGRVRFEALPALALKGVAQPVEVYRPLDMQSEDDVSMVGTTLVGRQTERARIEAAVAGLADGSYGDGIVVLLEGEPGIGKSVLVQHALQTAAASGITACLGAANAVERAAAYGPWRAVLSRLLGLEALADPAARTSRVMKNLAGRPEWVAWAPLLNEILPVSIPETDAVRQMPAALRGVNTRELVAHLVREVAEGRPLVIAHDDVQWMDASSWELASALARSMPRLLLLLATRPTGEHAAPVWRELAAQPECVHIVLDRLPREDVAALICQRLRVHEIPPDVAAVVCDRAEGHPFFAKELAQSLRDGGQLVVEFGHCRLAPDTRAEDLELPGTIQGVLNSRLDLLTPSEQLVVKVASVIGRVFHLEVLEAVLPVAEDRVRLGEHIASMARLGLVELESPPPNEAHAFEHILVQEAAHNLLTIAQRLELHRAVAEHYETRLESDTSLLPLLAHHWLMADEPANAIRILDRAGVASLGRGANSEAVTYFEHAQQLAEGEGLSTATLTEVRRQLDLGEAYLRLGQVERSKELNEEVLRRLGRPSAIGPRRAVGLGVEVSRQIVTVVARRNGPKNEDAEQRARRTLRAAAAARLVEHLYYARDTVGAFHCCLLGINEAEAAGEYAAAANAYNFLALGAMLLRRDGLAARYLDRARRTTDSGELALADLTEGVAYAVLGRWEDADRLIRHSWNLACSMNDAAMQGRAAEAYGLIDEVRNPAAALEHRKTQVRRAQESANPLQEFWGLLGVCAAHLVRGEGETAEALCTELAVKATDADATTQVRYQSLLAATCFATGHPERAAMEADRALALIRAWPSRQPSDLAAVAALAETCLALHEAAVPPTSSAASRARAACGAMKSYARMFPAGVPRHLRLEARRAVADGNSGRACQLLRRAEDAARRMDTPYDRAHALAALAALAPSGPDRQAHSDAADRILAQLAAEPGWTLTHATAARAASAPTD